MNSREELEKIAELCIKHNVLCISDEVYQHITYDKEHIRIGKNSIHQMNILRFFSHLQILEFKATFPGMWERTVTIGSAGKVFGPTGCKIGITIGPKELIKKNSMVLYNSVYCCPTFFQEVIARCYEHEFARLSEPDCYINYLPNLLRDKRDRFAKILIEAGLEPVVPEGGYFMLANITKFVQKINNGDADECQDVKLVKYLIKEKGLATIPISIFYSDENSAFGQNFIRFNFFKDEETLARAAEILKSLNN